MMGYDYEVLYRKGTSNTVSDTLSRRPCAHLQAIITLHSDLFDRIQLTWTSDPHLIKLISQLQQGTKSSTKFTWINNQLRRKGKLVVGQDDTLRNELLYFFHSSPTGGHSGMHPTMARISPVIYWKGLKKQMRQFVRACFTCK